LPATLLVGLLAVGSWQIGEGSWIYAKAGLAQILLERAWSRTLAGESAVRPWAWADTWPVARLLVPSMQEDLIVLNGAYGRTLAFGPGYAESSAFPGQPGTTILTAHRDTHFHFLKGLKELDEILLETSGGKRLRYLVQELLVMDESAAINMDKRSDRLVLVTCYPFEAIVPGGTLRYVVTAIAATGGE
jgi:sortase A